MPIFIIFAFSTKYLMSCIWLSYLFFLIKSDFQIFEIHSLNSIFLLFYEKIYTTGKIYFITQKKLKYIITV